jgi:ketosteroid isomerase-like protein
MLACAAPAVAEDAATVVEARERAWAAALVSKDLGQLASLLHPEFRLVTLYAPENSPVHRAEYLALQKGDPHWAFRGMTPIAVEVELRGEIAVATVEMDVTWPAGVPNPTDYRFTDVWALQGGEWRVIDRLSERRSD